MRPSGLLLCLAVQLSPPLLHHLLLLLHVISAKPSAFIISVTFALLGLYFCSRFARPPLNTSRHFCFSLKIMEKRLSIQMTYRQLCTHREKVILRRNTQLGYWQWSCWQLTITTGCVVYDVLEITGPSLPVQNVWGWVMCELSVCTDSCLFIGLVGFKLKLKRKTCFPRLSFGLYLEIHHSSS